MIADKLNITSGFLQGAGVVSKRHRRGYITSGRPPLKSVKGVQYPSLALLLWKPKQTITQIKWLRLLPLAAQQETSRCPPWSNIYSSIRTTITLSQAVMRPGLWESGHGSFTVSSLSGFERNVAFPRTRRKVGRDVETPEPYSRS